MFFMLIKLYMETCKGMNIRAYVLRNGHAKSGKGDVWHTLSEWICGNASRTRTIKEKISDRL